MSENKNPVFPDQVVPLFLTAFVFGVVAILLLSEIHILNFFVFAREKIVPNLRLGDVLIGTTIYLKTSIDFAIYIGRLMNKFPGWKNRVMIEIGTALGNAAGTMAILVIWDLFREVRILMALMILVAALVLFRLAEEGLDHVKDQEGKYTFHLFGFAEQFEYWLSKWNRAFAPVLNRLVPKLNVNDEGKNTLKSLFWLSFTIPFLLGLDDFAGYISLFNVVNIFGFGIGIFLGHTILNIFLFLSPKTTIQAVKNPAISFAGSLAFVGLGIWGIVEAVKLLGG